MSRNHFFSYCMLENTYFWKKKNLEHFGLVGSLENIDG